MGSYFDATLNGSVVNTGGGIKIRFSDDAGDTDVDPFNNSKWDFVIDLGERGTGPFSAGVTGLSQPNVYAVLMPSIQVGITWTAAVPSIQALPKSDRLVLGSPLTKMEITLSATEPVEMDDWKTGTAVNYFAHETALCG